MYWSKKIGAVLTIACCCALQGWAQGQWTLKKCLDYALENNIQVRRNRVSEEEGQINLREDKAALLPSLSFSTSQSVGYRPFEETTAIVQNGQVTNTSKKVTESGSYGLNANWTLWNGGINQKNIKAQRLQNQITELSTKESEQSIQEQVAQLFVQILYSREAKTVNEQLAATAKTQYERGVEMMKQGQIAKADVAQLEAGWKSAEYDIVSSETQAQNYIRQLKALLELGIDEPFDITGTEPTEELKKEIQNYVKQHTAPYKYPRIVVFRDELPKTISGKIQRALL